MRVENGGLNLRQQGLLSDDQVKSRMARRLLTEMAPSTKASTTGWVDWGAMADLLGTPFDITSIPLSKLEQMRRDPMIAFGLYFRKLPLVRAPWYIKSTDARRAQFVDSSLRRIYGRLVLAYCNSLDYGYSPMAKRFESISPDWDFLDKDDPDAKMAKVWPSSTKAVVWKPFVALNPRHSWPAWNSSGEFNGIYHNRNAPGESHFFKPSGKPDVPQTHALWATNEKDSVFGSLWGYPTTGYAYRYWWAYWYRFGLADRAFEKWADPPVIAYHPVEVGIDESGSKVDYTNEGLILAEKLRSGANVSLPSTPAATMDERPTSMRAWELAQMEVKANFDALNQAFEYLDVQKVRALMVPEQALMEGRGGTSSRNVAGEMGDLLMQAQALVMEEMSDMINRFMIPQILEANFGSGGASCEFHSKGFDPKDIDTLRSIVQGFANANPGELPVDLRGLLDDLGVPTLSVEHMQRKLEEQAAVAAQTLPPGQDATATTAAGPPGQAGVTTTGLYYDPRERIELHDSSLDWTVEVVDQLPVQVDGATAYFDKPRRKLLILEGADLSGLRSQMGESGLLDSEIVSLLLDRMDRMDMKLDDVARTSEPAPNIYVDVIVPERE